MTPLQFDPKVPYITLFWYILIVIQRRYSRDSPATMCLETRRRITIRPASVADSAAIARVCLLTAYQGRSAETLVRYPELPSQVNALPYLHLPSGFGFVLVETTEGNTQAPSSESEPESEKDARQRDEEERIELRSIVGYVVGTSETTQFQREVDDCWWPALKLKYPKDLIGTPLDRYFVSLIHKGPRLSAAGTAHIHPCQCYWEVQEEWI